MGSTQGIGLAGQNVMLWSLPDRNVLDARNFQTPQPFRFWYHPVGSDFGDCLGNRELPVPLIRSVPVPLARFLDARMGCDAADRDFRRTLYSEIDCSAHG